MIMEKLPFEVLLQVFEYLHISTYHALYLVFPENLIDEALVYKLRNDNHFPSIQLISTNLHELSATNMNLKNESSLGLYFTSYNAAERLLWFLPEFDQSYYYFRVKDAYVSHGKLVLRKPQDDVMPTQQIILSSLWDIRKSFPPTRAGSFSGASEYTTKAVQSQEFVIQRKGCILDSCLIPSVLNSNEGAVENGIKETEEQEVGLKKPKLPKSYSRRVPVTSPSSYPDFTCGYFLVERLALSIPSLLDLYT